MQCKSVLTRVDALRTGELEPDVAGVVKEHLGACPSCEESVHDLESLADIARQLRPQPATSLAGLLARFIGFGYDRVEAAGRAVWVIFSDRGIREIRLSPMPEEELVAAVERRLRAPLSPERLPDRLRSAIERALAGEDPGEVALDLEGVTPFERCVLDTIAAIPRGQVRSYRWVAEAVGKPKAVRAVGNVMARNPIPLILPCHRVVPDAGGVGNYGGGPSMKRHLLEAEGVPVEELEDLAAHGIRYIGSATTGICCFPTCPDARRILPRNRVPLHGAQEAAAKGFRPCRRCKPFAMAS